MDPVTAGLLITLLSEGAKVVFPAIISLMKQNGMTEAQIDEAWKAAYARFLTEDPNKLPTA
jgi:hypothetical protein